MQQKKSQTLPQLPTFLVNLRNAAELQCKSFKIAVMNSRLFACNLLVDSAISTFMFESSEDMLTNSFVAGGGLACLVFRSLESGLNPFFG